MASDITTVTDSMGEESEDLFSSPEGETVANMSPNTASSSTVVRRLFSGNESPNGNPPLRDITNRSPSIQPPGPATGNDTQLLILQEVRKANSRLDTFSDRLEGLESRLASVEDKQLSSVTPSSSSSTDSSGTRGKRKVPPKVRVSSYKSRLVKFKCKQ